MSTSRSPTRSAAAVLARPRRVVRPPFLFLLSDFVGDRLYALQKFALGDLPVAVRVHSAPRPPRLRQRHAVDVLHGLLLLGFVNLSTLVLVQHREPEWNSLRPMTHDREGGQI